MVESKNKTIEESIRFLRTLGNKMETGNEEHYKITELLRLVVPNNLQEKCSAPHSHINLEASLRRLSTNRITSDKEENYNFGEMQSILSQKTRQELGLCKKKNI